MRSPCLHNRVTSEWKFEANLRKMARGRETRNIWPQLLLLWVQRRQSNTGIHLQRNVSGLYLCILIKQNSHNFEFSAVRGWLRVFFKELQVFWLKVCSWKESSLWRNGCPSSYRNVNLNRSLANVSHAVHFLYGSGPCLSCFPFITSLWLQWLLWLTCHGGPLRFLMVTNTLRSM